MDFDEIEDDEPDPTDKPKFRRTVAFLAVSGLFLCGGPAWVAWRAYAGFYVPAHQGSGHNTHIDLGNGWWKESFPEFQLSVELPCKVTFVRRELRASKTPWLLDYAWYRGATDQFDVSITSYWTAPGEARLTSGEEAAVYLSSLQKGGGYENLQFRSRPGKIAGLTCEMFKCSYYYNERVSVNGAIFVIGDHMVRIMDSFNPEDAPHRDADWNRICSSVHFGPSRL